ncbi:Stonin-2 [Manis pentadactyla]|nr:Stonin-2 [Manis pentadactyla]
MPLAFCEERCTVISGHRHHCPVMVLPSDEAEKLWNLLEVIALVSAGHGVLIICTCQVNRTGGLPIFFDCPFLVQRGLLGFATLKQKCRKTSAGDEDVLQTNTEVWIQLKAPRYSGLVEPDKCLATR